MGYLLRIPSYKVMTKQVLFYQTNITCSKKLTSVYLSFMWLLCQISLNSGLKRINIPLYMTVFLKLSYQSAATFTEQLPHSHAISWSSGL